MYLDIYIYVCIYVSTYIMGIVSLESIAQMLHVWNVHLQFTPKMAQIYIGQYSIHGAYGNVYVFGSQDDLTDKP